MPQTAMPGMLFYSPPQRVPLLNLLLLPQFAVTIITAVAFDFYRRRRRHYHYHFFFFLIFLLFRTHTLVH